MICVVHWYNVVRNLTVPQMGKRGPKPGQGGRPPRDPCVKRAWERLLHRVILPRVAKELKAKGTWVYVREHIKYVGKLSREEHTLRGKRRYWGSNFDPRKRDIAIRRAQAAGRKVLALLPAEQQRLMPPRFNWGINSFIRGLKSLDD